MIFPVIITILLFLLCLRLCIYIFQLKANMKNIQEELVLTRDMNYNRQLTVDLSDKNLSAMTAEINRNLDYQKKLKLQSEAAEMNLKQSVSDIAHDLRTPLTVISGNLQMLKDDSSISDSAREYIRICEEKCSAMKVISDDFFQLSVLESDFSSAELRSVNLTNDLMQFVADNEAIIRKNNLIPDIVFPDNSVFAYADPSLISRLFANLLTNVIKYASDSFRIVLSEEDESVSVTFINRIAAGTDIDTDQIFNRTYRADKSRNSSGAGIGLYIVKLLAEKQGAKVFAIAAKGELHIGVKLNRQNKETG